MKNYFFPFIFTALYLCFSGCSKDSTLLEADTTLQNRTAGIFQDTTGVEFFHILHLLNIENDSIEEFHERYGWPSGIGSFQKKNENTKITTIPLVKNNKITGIFKVYNSYEDSVKILFFSKENLDMILNSTLNTYDFHMYFGAIQSYYVSSYLRKETISNIYEIWLQQNTNRIEERVEYHCIYNWDCFDTAVASSTMEKPDHKNSFTEWLSRFFGAIFSETFFSIPGCILVSVECWIEWGETLVFTSGNNWNHYPWINNSATGYMNSLGNNIKIKPWEEQVLLDAKDCIQEAGIKGVMAKAGLEEAADNSCARSYNSLLVETYINLIEQNKDCTDGEAWMEEMENTKEKYAYPFFSEEVKQFFEENELIDPCTGNSIADMLNDEACGSEEMLTMEDLEVELTELDKIIPDWETLNTHCPNFKCVYEYLLNTGNPLFCDKLYINFEYDNKITLNISGFYQPGGAAGQTSYNGNIINIKINGIACNNPLEIASTLIHESIHASLYKEARIKDPSITRTEIIKILRQNSNISDIDHEVMAKRYVTLIAQSLREADGNRYPIEYYMYLAWSGIQSAGYELGILDDVWASQYYDEYNILIGSSQTFCN